MYVIFLESFRLQLNLQFKLQRSTFFNDHLFTLQETKNIGPCLANLESYTNGKKIRTSKVLDLEPNLPDSSPT